MPSKDFVRIFPSKFNTDLPPVEQPLEVVNKLTNMRLRSGRYEQIGGKEELFRWPVTLHHIGGSTSQITELPDPVYKFGYARTVNDYVWVLCTKNNLFVVFDRSNIYDITPAGFTPVTYGDRWTIHYFNGLLIFNVLNNPPFYWNLDVTSRAASLTGWPANTYCRDVVGYKNYLIALGITTPNAYYPDLIWWSEPADSGAVPPGWTVDDPTTLAGKVDVSESRGELQTAVLMKGSLIVYKTQSIYKMDFIRGNFIFSIQPLFHEVGALNPDSVVSVKGIHYVFTGYDIIRHDGFRYDSLIENRVKDDFFRRLGPDIIKRNHTYFRHNPAKNEIQLYFPSGDLVTNKPNACLIYQYEQNDFAFCTSDDKINDVEFGSAIADSGNQVGGVWDSINETWDNYNYTWQTSVGANTPIDSLLEALHDQKTISYIDIATIPMKFATIHKYTIPFKPEQAVKFLYKVEFEIDTIATDAAQFEARFGYQMNLTDPITWGKTYYFSVVDSGAVFDILLKGRYFSFKIISRSQVQWRLNSVGFYIKVTEEY